MSTYLEKLRRVQSVPKAATYIRAMATHYAPSFAMTQEPSVALSIICGYEYDAIIVENCKTIQEARRYMKEKGYLPWR